MNFVIGRRAFITLLGGDVAAGGAQTGFFILSQ
jgi:hypothetical protein